MHPDRSHTPFEVRGRRGFTLTELLTVVGLVALLLSLLMPVVSKVRAASSNTTCLANMRHMGVAWSLYVADNDGRIPHYAFDLPLPVKAAWYGYWPGILDKNGVRGDAILCPEAREPLASDRSNGFGNVSHAWSGRYIYNGNAVRLDDKIYRTSSYGYNRYLTIGNFAQKYPPIYLAQISDTSNVPAFFDCAYPDAAPPNASPASPPDLRGTTLDDHAPQQWRFMLGRHGRGINVAMADGSARWVRLDETYLLRWNADWLPRRISLPSF